VIFLLPIYRIIVIDHTPYPSPNQEANHVANLDGSSKYITRYLASTLLMVHISWAKCMWFADNPVWKSVVSSPRLGIPLHYSSAVISPSFLPSNSSLDLKLRLLRVSLQNSLRIILGNGLDITVKFDKSVLRVTLLLDLDSICLDPLGSILVSPFYS